MTDLSLLERWRAAEADLGRPGRARALDGAEARSRPPLPPRVWAIALAMEALDRGDPAEIARVADRVAQAQADDPDAPHHPGVAALLRTLLAPPGTTPPGALAGVPETVELPTTELIAVVDRARAGVFAPAPPRLELAAKYRPLLHAAHRCCTEVQGEVYSNPVIAAFSRRADQLQLGVRAAQITGFLSASRLAAALTEDGLHLDAERWPDPLIQLSADDPMFWATTRIPWSDRLDRAIAALLSREAGARTTTLGAMLARIAREVEAGRIAGLTRPVQAAFSLAWSLPGRPELQTQLALLQLRIERFDPEHTGRAPTLWLHLLQHGAHLNDGDRLAVARRVLSEALAVSPPELVEDAAWIVMAESPDADEAAEALLQRCARWSPERLAGRIATAGTAPGHRPLNPTRVALIRGLHAASHASWTAAIAAMLELAAAGEAPRVGAILRCAAASCARGAPAPGDDLIQVWDALAGAPLAVWAPALVDPHLSGTIGPAHRAGVLDAALAEADRAGATAPPAAEATAARALCLHALGADAAARQVILELGRYLRAAPPATGADLTLQVIAWWFSWSPAQGRALMEGPGRPLAAALMRSQAAPVQGAIQRFPLTGPLPGGAVDWWLTLGPDRPDGAAWRDRLRALLSVPPHLADLLTQVAHTADLRASTSLGEAAATLHRCLVARLELSR